MAVDFSIVIPHRGNSLGLWATIHSCEAELEGSNHKYNYVLMTNGEKLPLEAVQTISFLDKSGKLKCHEHSNDPISPPVARQRGVERSDGRLLFFLDNHCVVAKRYFDRGVAQMATGKMDMLHSATRWYEGDATHYHYLLSLDYNFWGRSTKLAPYDAILPYKIAMGGHGGFVTSRALWDEVGGYGPESLLQGYGGEEPLFDLKLWRYGKTVWIDPRLAHYHYTGLRGYTRHYSDEYYINMLVAANVIGGEDWLYKVFNSLCTRSHIRPLQAARKTLYELLEDAVTRSSEYAKEVDSKSIRSLNECLTLFRTDSVEH